MYPYASDQQNSSAEQIQVWEDQKKKKTEEKCVRENKRDQPAT